MHHPAHQITPQPVTTQSTPTREVISWSIQDIIVPPRLRAVDPDSVRTLADSIKTLGLLEPIVIRDGLDDQGKAAVVVVAGAHRLAACKLLSFEKIDVFLFEGTDDEARQIEIAENLHRRELTAMERDRHIAEWIRLTVAKGAQVGQVSKGGRGNQGGISAATRELGITRQEAQRALKTAQITAEAQQAVIEAGLADNRAAQLRIAEQETPEAQLEAVKVERAMSRRPRVQDPLKAFLAKASKAWELGYTRLFNAAGDEWIGDETPTQPARTPTLPPHLIAERDTFCAIAPWEEIIDPCSETQTFLGFTRNQWLGPFEDDAIHTDLVLIAGMVEVVDRWRREAATAIYAGEDGPIPDHWNMPDLIEQWERDNPEIIAEQQAEADAFAKERAARQEKARKRAERVARKAAKVAAARNAVGGTTTAPVESDMTDSPVP